MLDAKGGRCYLSAEEKLQKAVETTIAAGYQLDRGAFELLSTVAIANDPTAIVKQALTKMEQLEEKPMFIDKPFLENILRKSELAEESIAEPVEKKRGEIERPTIEGPVIFQPYARDIEPELNTIEDPTGKLTSNGTMEEYLQYFQDRFKRIERLLRQRIDVKAAAPIAEALKSQPKTKLKIIGMITEKREVKRQTLVTIEDLEASATVLISNRVTEEVHRKAQQLLPDQVVCMAVSKTRSNLFLAEDIIFPEVGQKLQHRAAEPIYAALTSDLHVGSNKFNKDSFKRFILWLNGKYGNESMREIAGRVKYVLIAGDIVDGVGVYPNQNKELLVKDVHKQYKLSSKLIERIPDYIEVVITPGNHDAPRKALPMPAISEDYLEILQRSKRVHSLGDPSLVSLHKVEVLMYHGRSLDDVIASVPGLDHSHPEKAMKLLLQGRHLAPIYGGRTLISPENRDYLVMDKVPDILHSGHVHVVGCCNHRGVLVVNSGGWQEQTDYMQKLGLVPTPGKVPVVNLQTLETHLLSFL